MATMSAITVALAARPSPVAGLPQLRVARAERLRCSYYKDQKNKASSTLAPAVVKCAPLLSASTMTAAAAPMLGSALALADERIMSIEGLSNDLLGWILLVAFGVVLSFYAVHSSTLDDHDDQSGTRDIKL